MIQKLNYEKEVIGIYLTGHPLDNYRLEMDYFCTVSIADLKVLDRLKAGQMDTEEDMDKFKRISAREIYFGGLVSSVQHRVTKMGKPFGVFVVEDYSDSYEIALFGEDYVKFKHYLQDGYFIYIHGNIQKSYRQDGSYELKIASMHLLSEIRDKKVKFITLHLSIVELSLICIQQINEAIDNNVKAYSQRNCQLKFAVYDDVEQIMVEMSSKTVKLYPGNDFFAFLQQRKINYKLN